MALLKWKEILKLLIKTEMCTTSEEEMRYRFADVVSQKINRFVMPHIRDILNMMPSPLICRQKSKRDALILCHK